jgi:hypothetical protein
MSKPTAKEYIKKLKSLSSKEDKAALSRYFKTGKGEYGEGDVFMGVRSSVVYSTAKDFLEMEPREIEIMLRDPIHEIRAAGLSIMSRIARKNKTSQEKRKELYELYLRNHKGINNWDLVDVSCAYVIGRFLFDKKRDILYKLAKSQNIWERRTAMVSTAYFIKQGELGDAFKIAEMLLGDKHDLIHKATGWMLRMAGDKDKKKLIQFLDKFAAIMPRTALRYSLEHFSDKERKHYMELKSKLNKS